MTHVVGDDASPAVHPDRNDVGICYLFIRAQSDVCMAINVILYESPWSATMSSLTVCKVVIRLRERLLGFRILRPILIPPPDGPISETWAQYEATPINVIGLLTK